jgi:acylphosphatase
MNPACSTQPCDSFGPAPLRPCQSRAHMWGHKALGPSDLAGPHPEMLRQREISEETNYNSMKRLRAFVSGTVQMNGYPAKVASLANFLGLVGFVQNLPDGRVKVVAEGDDSALERFLDASKAITPPHWVTSYDFKRWSPMVKRISAWTKRRNCSVS